jgi:hypothetical protein
MSLQKNNQNLFFKNITDIQLNELLYRFDTNILARHIITELHRAGLYNINIQTKLTHVNNDVSAYINYHYNGKKRIHMSFHLTGIDFRRTVIGPIHVVNNTRKRICSPLKYKSTRKLSCNISHRNTIKYKQISNKQKLLILKLTTDVLNTYFVSSDPYYLDTLLATPPNTLHPYLLLIIQQRKLLTKDTHIIQTSLTSHLV